MTTALETAFPLGANWIAATVRAKLAEAMIGVFTTPNLSAENFAIQPYRALAIVGDDGALDLYGYDAADTTTADDGGISCIVVSGRRYKRRAEAIVRDAVFSATEDTQPGSPSLGDGYIIPVAPSGADWATQAGTVATFTARGWLFREPFIGMVVYVEDEETFYHYDANGDWVSGLPIGAIADGSIPPKKLAHPFAILKVEGTQNAPPGGSPGTGIMYQVGTSPTGAWSGHPNEVARWNALGAWEFLAPAEGDTIYRKDFGRLYTYRSGAWTITTSSPAILRSYYVEGSSAGSASALTNRLSSPSIIAEAGQKIRVTVNIVSLTITGTANAGIRIDSTGSINKNMVTSGASLANTTLMAEIDVPDSSAHVYHFATSGGNTSNVVLRVTFEVIQPS